MSDEDYKIGVTLKVKERAAFLSAMEAMKKAVEGVGNETKKTGGKVKESTRALNGYHVSLGAVMGVAATGARTLGYLTTGLAGAGIAAGVMGIKTAASLEQTNIGYKTLLGSQAAATEQLDKLRTLAANTPFNFKGLSEAGKKMLAYGFGADQLVNNLTAIGNASSALGAGQEGVDSIIRALGQMKQKGTLSAEELNQQLAEVGINGWKYLADASGNSIAQVQKDAQNRLISGTWAAQTIINGMNKEFAGSMEAQSKTLSGRWSNMVDVLQGKLYRVNAQGGEEGIAAPLLKVLRDALPEATVLAGKGMDLLGVGIEHGVAGFKDLVAAYKQGGVNGLLLKLGDLTGTGSKLSTVWKHISEDGKNVADIFQNSVWPAAKNVATVFGPPLLLGLMAVEGILKWMADHPTAASMIFTTLGSVLITYGIATSLLRIVDTMKAMRLAVLGTAAAYRALGASAASATVAAGSSAAAGATGLAARSGVVAGLASKGKWLLGGAAGAAGLGLYAGDKIANKLNINGTNQGDKHYDETTEGVGSMVPPALAAGGTVTAAGRVQVGERGREWLDLPAGAQVKPLSPAEKAGSGGGQVVYIQDGAIQVSGSDVLNARRTADIIMEQLRTKIARS